MLDETRGASAALHAAAFAAPWKFLLAIHRKTDIFASQLIVAFIFVFKLPSWGVSTESVFVHWTRWYHRHSRWQFVSRSWSLVKLRRALKRRCGSCPVVFFVRLHRRKNLMKLNRPRWIIALHKSSCRVRIRFDNVHWTVNNRAGLHWLIHSQRFVDQNRHDPRRLWLSLGDTAHDFHRRRCFHLVSNFVPPRWQHQSKLWSLHDPSVLLIATNLDRKLLCRSIQNLNDTAFDEDFCRYFGNHSSYANALSDKKLQNF